jgi:hypothetical protein
LLIPNGAACSGDHVFLRLRRATTAPLAKARVRAKVNIDDANGPPLFEAFNGGPQVDFIGADGARCSFYIGWDDAIPFIKVDRVPPAGARIPVYRSRALMPAPVAAGHWVDVELGRRRARARRVAEQHDAGLDRRRRNRQTTTSPSARTSNSRPSASKRAARPRTSRSASTTSRSGSIPEARATFAAKVAARALSLAKVAESTFASESQ